MESPSMKTSCNPILYALCSLADIGFASSSSSTMLLLLLAAAQKKKKKKKKKNYIFKSFQVL